MPPALHRFYKARPFAAGAVSGIAMLLGAVSLAAAANHVRPFITGTLAYEDAVNGPIIQGLQDGAGIGIEGVADTGAPAGAIGVDGFGTSTTQASVGVNGSVDGPGSTALIGNANDTMGLPSIGLEGFSQNGEGVFAEGSAAFPSLRAVDQNLFYDVRAADSEDGNALTSMLETGNNGAAIDGVDTVTSVSGNIGVIGETASGLYGVEGIADPSGNATAGGFFVSSTGSGAELGMEAASTNGTAAEAESQNGMGVYGSSNTTNGVEGETFNPSATTENAEAGVFGLDGSTDGGTENVGVEGSSNTGIGVLGASIGVSSGNFGVLGFSNSSDGVFGDADSNTTFGVEGMNSSTDSAGTGGVLGVDQDGAGVWGDAEVGVVGQCASNAGDEFMGEDENGDENFTVDCTGMPSMIVRTRHNALADATVPASTQSVIEDYGEAQLVNGAATVRLDPAFADAITDHAVYLVFVTPDGDTNGLFVSGKTPTGFQVREVRGGHSSLTFDYRIVARPANDDRPRMTLAMQAVHSLGKPVWRETQLHQRIASTVAANLAKGKAAYTIGRLRTKPGLTLRHRTAKRMPIYEPRIGPDGRLHPGQLYNSRSRE
jgi:hypothetical protein